MTVESNDTILLYDLDTTASSAVFEQAVELRTNVRIFADHDLSVVLIEGPLSDVTDEHLRIAVTHKNTSSLAVNVLSVLKGEFTLGEVTYVFDVMSLDEFPGSADQTVLIPRPASVAVSERRRTRRRQFHDAGDLTLTPIGCDSTAPIPAALLNVSPDGLACLVPESTLEFIPSDGRLVISLALAENGQVVELTGQMVSRTEAGTPGHLVVGLEFDKRGQTQQRSLLRQALQDSAESTLENQ
ncbi:MAG: hypothetical protein IH987_06975 [Planctomycetes bacterium]|nr:hypothetical protein [Planctomycetota bacterium]